MSMVILNTLQKCGEQIMGRNQNHPNVYFCRKDPIARKAKHRRQALSARKSCLEMQICLKSRTIWQLTLYVISNDKDYKLSLLTQVIQTLNPYLCPNQFTCICCLKIQMDPDEQYSQMAHYNIPIILKIVTDNNIH